MTVPALTLGCALHLALRAVDAAHEATIVAHAGLYLVGWHAERHVGSLVLALTMLRPR